ncbi:MAG: hypothetical protein AB7F89_21155 [Pirellulaceae bacterium]
MPSQLDHVENAPQLSVVAPECLAAIEGGTRYRSIGDFFDIEAKTGVVFATNGIWYMNGDGKWVQVTNPKPA